MREQGLAVRSLLDLANPSNVYFRDMGLDEVLAAGTSTVAAQQWSGSHQNTGLHVIRSASDLEKFRKSASRLTLHHCEEAADALRYAMTELGRNVL